MTYPIEVKEQVKERRLLGLIPTEISEELAIPLSTVTYWCRQEASEDTAQANVARMRRILDMDMDLNIGARERVATRLPFLEDKDLIRAYQAISAATNQTIR